MPKNKTKTIVTSLFFADILLIGIFFVLYTYTTNQITETINETDQIKIEIKKQESQSFMKKDVADVKNYKNILDTYLVQKNDVVGFIKILEGIVASSSLKSEVNSVTYETSSELTPIGVELLRANVTVTGEWKNIQAFLVYLENYPLQISIKKVSLDKFSNYQVKGKQVPQWSGNFEFTVAILKDK